MKDHIHRELLLDAIVPIPFQEVTKILECAYGQSQIFKELDKLGETVSLGQMHFGKLNDGTEVAVKIHWPNIVSAVKPELGIMGCLPKTGPVAKWDFKIDDYRDVFWQNFSEEFDNRIEIGHQIQYRKMIFPLGRIIIPEIIEDLCRPNILVQKREEGFGLDKA